MVREFVKEGYRSLAKRALERFHEGKLVATRPETEEILAAFKENLEDVSASGEVRSMKHPRRLLEASDLFDLLIVDELKPTDNDLCVNVPLFLLAEHYNLTTTEMWQRLDFEKITITKEQSGIEFRMTKERKMQKKLYIYTDEERPAFALTLNLKSMYQGMLPEQVELWHTTVQQEQIPDYKTLLHVLQHEKHLHKLYQQDILGTHNLTFFQRPEVMQKAFEAGIDLEKLVAHLARIKPKADFLSCYVSGDAFLKTEEIVRKSSELAKYPQSAYYYQVIALTSCFIAPFNKVRSVVHEVGIGLAEFFRIHPDYKELLMHSQEFHRKISETYFKEKMSC